MIKKCLICGNEFETLPKGGSRKYCFQCSPSYPKGDNQRRAQTLTAIRHALKTECLKRLGGKFVKCGYNKCPSALEFHHLDPNEKEFDIGHYITGANVKEDIFSELQKCTLLCSNCHKEFHYYNSNNDMSFEDFLNH